MLGLATEGLALITEGELKEGMRRLDEATAAALAGEYEEYVGVGWTCCYLIYACERVRDYDRAAQWCRNVEEFAERMRIQFLHGVCRVHYAGVLTWHGSWKEADDVLSKAIADLAATRPPFAHEGLVRLADLRRRQGRVEEAERLFMEAESHPMAAVGMAELSLDRDDPGGAVPVAERLLRQHPLANRTQRVAALELAVRAKSAAGDAEGARAHLDELRSVAHAVPTSPLRAAASFCDGVVAAAAGDHESAAVAFEDASRCSRRATRPTSWGAPARSWPARLPSWVAGIWHGGRPPPPSWFSSARGRACSEGCPGRTRRPHGGEPPAGRPPDAPRAAGTGLIARGMRDGDIANALSLSQHTVHRHVSNIYAKLGCSTRAAAVAKATGLGML